MILYIKHIPIEGPDTLGEYFSSRGFRPQEVDLSRGDRLPKNFDGIEAVVCLGGPMNVYEEDKYPFLKHEDMFQVPAQGELLAASAGCPHQAFRVGTNAYGLQFHIEITDTTIENWIKEYWQVDDARSVLRGKEMLDRPQELKRRFDQQAKIIYNNFLNIMTR